MKRSAEDSNVQPMSAKRNGLTIAKMPSFESMCHEEAPQGHRGVVGGTGLEPVTSCTSSMRSPN